MKANEFIKKNWGLLIICIFAIILSIYLIITIGAQVIIGGDSESYIDAAESIYQGRLHADRTPVYPLLIGFFKIISGEDLYLTHIVIFQYIFFIFSLCVFYLIARELGLPNRISFLISLIYILFFVRTGNYIMSESISISLMVFLFYVSIRIFKYGLWKDVIFLTVILILSIFTRPIFVYLLPIFLICFLLNTYAKSYLFTLKGIISLAICSLFIVGYMSAFQSTYDLFAISRVSLINQYQICRMNNLIDEKSIADSALKEDILRAYQQNGRHPQINGDLWGETFSIMDNQKLSDIQSMLLQARIKNWKRYGLSLFHSFFQSCSFSIRPTLFGSILPLFGLNLFYLYLFILFYSIILCYSIFKNGIRTSLQNPPMLSILMVLISIGNVVVVILGAQSDWCRLILPSMPFVLLMLGQVISPVTKESIDKIAFQ